MNERKSDVKAGQSGACEYLRDPQPLLITRLLHISAAARKFGFSWSESEFRSNMSGTIRMILLLALAVCVCQAQRECFHRCSAVFLHVFAWFHCSNLSFSVYVCVCSA